MALGNLQLLENPVEKCSLRELLAKASPLRSGDVLAGIAAENEEERIRAQMALADVPLKRFLSECVVPYETDEVTRLIMDSHDAQAFAPVSSFTVGQLRDWLLTPAADTATLTALAPGLTPEMVAAASKLMRIQDLVLVASKCSVVTRFRDTIGLPGRFSSRLQPNHPTDDARGVLASVIDGLQYGSGDAVIGINPASDSLPAIGRLLRLLDDVIARYDIPTQSCVLTHVTNTLEMIRRGVPVDLCFQSIAGTEKANASFGISLSLLDEAWDATLSLKRGTVGDNVMYFETGQGSALSAGAHFGVDQQTLECRAYAVARRYRPLLVNTVVGFIGPEYLFNGKQIIRTRPDKGRRLSVASRQLLDAWMDAHPGSAPDVSVVICDGLSARAVHENAVPFATRFLEEAAAAGLSAAPVALVKFGRVAVGDDVAALLNARLVVVLVGERPGLSSPDSLGVYMTHAPTPGLTDEARNCISNVRAAGLPVEEAVRKLCYLVENALVRRLSGVDLKDDVPPGYLPFAETRALG